MLIFWTLDTHDEHFFLLASLDESNEYMNRIQEYKKSIKRNESNENMNRTQEYMALQTQKINQAKTFKLNNKIIK